MASQVQNVKTTRTPRHTTIANRRSLNVDQIPVVQPTDGGSSSLINRRSLNAIGSDAFPKIGVSSSQISDFTSNVAVVARPHPRNPSHFPYKLHMSPNPFLKSPSSRIISYSPGISASIQSRNSPFFPNSGVRHTTSLLGRSTISLAKTTLASEQTTDPYFIHRRARNSVVCNIYQECHNVLNMSY